MHLCRKTIYISVHHTGRWMKLYTTAFGAASWRRCEAVLQIVVEGKSPHICIHCPKHR